VDAKWPNFFLRTNKELCTNETVPTEFISCAVGLIRFLTISRKVRYVRRNLAISFLFVVVLVEQTVTTLSRSKNTDTPALHLFPYKKKT